jgi:ATP-dependent Clp protease ATP-binding subunit ClpB
LAKLEKELADQKARADALRSQWQVERAVERLRKLRQEIDQTRIEIEQAERAYDLNKAAELHYGKLADLERRLQSEEELLQKNQGGSRKCQ